MNTTTLDTEFARSNFPAFSDNELKGWAFFENAGGSYPCKQVINRLTDFYQRTKVQPYAPYPASTRAGLHMDESYASVATYLNVEPSEISFGPSTSQNVYVLAQSFLSKWHSGDEIIVTNQDHEANSGPWRRLAEHGIVVREWSVDPVSGCLDLDSLDRLLSDKTRLVAFPHCSNIVAHINPVDEICRRAHAAGAVTVVDGVSYAGHGFPDVDALGTDIYLFSTYKTFGPHLGLMVVREPTLDFLTNQSHYFNSHEPHAKLVPAGPDHAQIAAVAGIGEYFDAIHSHHFDDSTTDTDRSTRVRELFQNHERQLLEKLLGYIETRDDLRLVGPNDPQLRAPTVSLVTERDTEEVVADLRDRNIMCWNGDFYSRRLIEALGINSEDGVLRLSFVHYTSADEVQQLIRALEATAG